MGANKKDKKPMTTANWSSGMATNQSPYRNGLIGVDSILSALTILVRHFEIKKGAITIALDCESDLKTCLPINPLSIKMPSFNILQDIRKRLAMLAITITWRSAKRHQKKGKKIDWWARQNFAADLGAKDYFLKKCQHNKQLFQPIQLLYKYWALYYDNTKQLCKNPTELYKQISY